MAGEFGRELFELTALAREDPTTAAGLVDGPNVQARLAALMLGAALAAVDEYEAFVRSRITAPVPAAAGELETDRRRWLGVAIGRLETARCILLALEPEPEAQLWALAREASRLAYTTVQDLIPVAAGAGAGLASTVGVMATLWGDESGAEEDQVLRRLARERLGVDA